VKRIKDLTGEMTHAGSDTFARTKRSFLRLPVPVDVDRLRAEYDSIPDTAWGVSFWDVHCSIDVLLLRGGDRGVEDDFGTTDIHNSPILDDLPYASSLLAPNGPLGGARYAFLFRTKPNGITRVHDDQHDFYQRAMRVHVPIVTNPGAFLLSEGRSKHFAVGEMWTFDNQSQHSVVNGGTERVHMIIDVDPNPTLAALVDDAVFDPGEEDPERWARTLDHVDDGADRPFIPFDGHPLTITEKADLGLDTDGFATRIVSRGRSSSMRSMLLRFGLCAGASS
jgi:kumamolisin